MAVTAGHKKNKKVQSSKNVGLRKENLQKSSTGLTGKPFRWLTWGLALFVIAFLLYANTIPHKFVLDDSGILKDNRFVTQGIGGIPIILKTSYRSGSSMMVDNLYRPLSLVMYALEWQLFPNSPAFHHFINVLFYALSCLLLLFVLRKLFNRTNPLFIIFVCFLWMAHPVHTEVVANIKSRDEIMSVFFLLLAVLGFTDYLNRNHVLSLVASVTAYFLSLMSKEGSITFLVLFPLTGWFFTKAPVRRNLIASLLFLIPALVYIYIRHVVLSHHTLPFQGVLAIEDNLLMAAPSAATRIATAVKILGKYLLLLVFPYQLVSDYSFNQIPIVDFTDPLVWLSLLVYSSGLVYAFLKIGKKSMVTYGLLFYLVTMSIYSNLFMLIGSSFGERFLFLPSIGFCILLGWLIVKIGMTDLNQVNPVDYKRIFTLNKLSWGILGVILLLYSYKTVDRNAEWKDQFTLFSADVRRSPNSSRMHYYLGMTLRDKAKEQTDQDLYHEYMKQAIKHFDTAISIYPNFGECYQELALAEFREGANDLALKYYNEALKYNPYDPVSYANQGIIYYQRGELQKALELYKKSIELDSTFDDGYYNLGNTYGMMGQFDLAIKNFKQCIRLKPDYAMAYYYLGVTYQNTNNPSEAKKYFDKAYLLQPSLRNMK